MDAPASNASRADCAICWGETGTGCCLGLVSTPFSAQVRMALSISGLLLIRVREFEEEDARFDGVSLCHMDSTDGAVHPCEQARFHLHRLDDGERVSRSDGAPGRHVH